MQKPQRQQIQIELKEPESEGIYSNMVVIGHSASEIILDFARFLPGLPKAKVYSRIIMTPQHAKLLLKSLEDNVKKFEKQFGEIKLQGMPDQKNIGFSQPESSKGQ